MSDALPQTAELFLEFSRHKLLDQYWPRLRACVESLSEEQVWWRPNDASNSIGNLVLHLNGNVTQWLVAPFKQLEDMRDRPAEFARKDRIAPAELVDLLGKTMSARQKSSPFSPRQSCTRVSTSRAITSPACTPFIRLLSTSACTTARSPISPSCCARAILASTASSLPQAARSVLPAQCRSPRVPALTKE